MANGPYFSELAKLKPNTSHSAQILLAIIWMSPPASAGYIDNPSILHPFPSLDLRAIRVYVYESRVWIAFIRFARSVGSIQRPWWVRRGLALQRRHTVIRDTLG